AGAVRRAGDLGHAADPRAEAVRGDHPAERGSGPDRLGRRTQGGGGAVHARMSQPPAARALEAQLLAEALPAPSGFFAVVSDLAGAPRRAPSLPCAVLSRAAP